MVMAEGNGCQLQQTHVSTVKKKNILTKLFSVKLYLKSYPPLRVHARTAVNIKCLQKSTINIGLKITKTGCHKKEDQLTCHEHISQSKEVVSCNGRHYTSYIP